MNEEELFFERETAKHRDVVKRLLWRFADDLKERAMVHDVSKTEEPERSKFVEATPKLKKLTYGSDEYKKSLEELGEALKHHYEHNRHHPEHYKLWKCPVCGSVFKEEETRVEDVYDDKSRLCLKCSPLPSYNEAVKSELVIYDSLCFEEILEPHIGLEGMTLLDIVEMFFDWCAAVERHEDGDIMDSLEKNEKRFNISRQLSKIFKNTAEEMANSSSR